MTIDPKILEKTVRSAYVDMALAEPVSELRRVASFHGERDDAAFVAAEIAYHDARLFGE
jgi:hypothetical protein